MSIVLVPVDFSDVSENALETAKIIAKKMNATLHIAHIYSLPIADYSHPDAIMTSEILDQLKKDAMHELSATKKKLEEEGFKVNATVSMGMISEEVVDLADKLKADLIVMGTTGSSGIINKIMGSNAANVLQHTMQPILLVPKEFKSNSFNNVVYLDELKEDDTEVLRKLFSFAEILGVLNIKILNVNTGFFFKPIDEKLMIQLDNAFGLEKIKLDTVDGADLKEGIEHYLENHFVDLLVMSTHKKSFLERIFAKNDTVKIAQYNKVPLLVYHKD